MQNLLKLFTELKSLMMSLQTKNILHIKLDSRYSWVKYEFLADLNRKRTNKIIINQLLLPSNNVYKLIINTFTCHLHSFFAALFHSMVHSLSWQHELELRNSSISLSLWYQVMSAFLWLKDFLLYALPTAFFQHDIILTMSCHWTFVSPFSLNTSEFTNFGVQSVILQYNITHRCMIEAFSQLHLWYYDRTLPQLHLIKTMTLQEGSKVVRNMLTMPCPMLYIPISNHHLHQRNA